MGQFGRTWQPARFVISLGARLYLCLC